MKETAEDAQPIMVTQCVNVHVVKSERFANILRTNAVPGQGSQYVHRMEESAATDSMWLSVNAHAERLVQHVSLLTISAVYGAVYSSALQMAASAMIVQECPYVGVPVASLVLDVK